MNFKTIYPDFEESLVQHLHMITRDDNISATNKILGCDQYNQFMRLPTQYFRYPYMPQMMNNEWSSSMSTNKML